MSSRHTTTFTTDPVFRARQEIRNRLERLRDEAEVTAGAVNAFGGNDFDQQMWEQVVVQTTSMIDGLNAVTDAERQNKTAAASATRMANARGERP